MTKIYTARELRELHLGADTDAPIGEATEDKVLTALRFGARNAVAARLSSMRTIVDSAEREHRALLASEQRDYDRHQDELAKVNLLAQETEAALAERATLGGHIYDGNLSGDGTGPAWMGSDEGRAFLHYVRTGAMGESRAQGVGTGSAGGFLVPAGYRSELVQRLRAFDAVRRVAQVVTTEDGRSMPWATVDDTANEGTILAENTQVAELDVLFGTASLGAYAYSSGLVRFSNQLLQDSDINLVSFLTRALGERIGRIQSRHFTTGTGTAQPTGIVTGATTGVTAGSTTALTADNLVDLVHSVDPAYREPTPGHFVGFMLSDLTLRDIRKLKDTTNRYLLQPAVDAGAPTTLLGYPVVVNPLMAAPAANVKAVLFGDLTAGYVIRDVDREGAMTVLRERYADFNQTGVLQIERADGTVQNANAYRALTMAAV